MSPLDDDFESEVIGILGDLFNERFEKEGVEFVDETAKKLCVSSGECYQMYNSGVLYNGRPLTVGTVGAMCGALGYYPEFKLLPKESSDE